MPDTDTQGVALDENALVYALEVARRNTGDIGKEIAIRAYLSVAQEGREAVATGVKPMTVGRIISQIALWGDDEGLELAYGQGDDLARRILSTLAAPVSQEPVAECISAPCRLEPGCSVIFTGNGVVIEPPVAPDATTAPSIDDLLDQFAAIRDEYVAKRATSLDQMELNAQQENTADVSAYSSEAERHGAAVQAIGRILDLTERFACAPLTKSRRTALTAAIGAGGQAVADSLWVPAKPEHKKIGWTYDFDQTERLSRAAEKATGYEGTMEVIEFVMAEADRRHKSALSQPHPADERVVEALERLREVTNRRKVGQPYLVGGSSPEAIIDHAIRALDLSMMRHDMVEDLKAGRVKPAISKEGR